MFGAVAKTWYAKKMGIDPKDIVCSRRYALYCQEVRDQERPRAMRSEGLYDVDVAITTRELARMIERAGINFTSLPDERI